MRIGLSTAAFYGRHETEDAAAKVASLGVSCCEVFFQTYSEYNRAFGTKVKRNIGATKAISIHSKTQHFEADIIGISKRQIKDAFATLGGFLDAGQTLGANVYVYHGPPDIRKTNRNFERWREPVERAMQEAEARGISLCWETVSWCYLTSPERVREFRRIWPGLGFVLDVKQVFEMKQNPLDYVKAMGDRLMHVHLLDHDEGGSLVLPGKGIHDFRDFAAALREIRYQGAVILEPYANTYRHDEELIDSLRWMGEVFQAEPFVKGETG